MTQCDNKTDVFGQRHGIENQAISSPHHQSREGRGITNAPCFNKWSALTSEQIPDRQWYAHCPKLNPQIKHGRVTGRHL
ncbi:Uncharacterised protein [Vibrio cholerae]|nr:Uncharacterised protein [Vibrio cholerae]